MVYTDEMQKKAEMINHLDALFQDWFEDISQHFTTEQINKMYPDAFKLRQGFIDYTISNLVDHHEITHLDGTCRGHEISSHGCDSRVTKDEHGFTTTKPICEALGEECPFTFRVEKGRVCGFAQYIMEA